MVPVDLGRYPSHLKNKMINAPLLLPQPKKDITSCLVNLFSTLKVVGFVEKARCVKIYQMLYSNSGLACPNCEWCANAAVTRS